MVSELTARRLRANVAISLSFSLATFFFFAVGPACPSGRLSASPAHLCGQPSRIAGASHRKPEVSAQLCALRLFFGEKNTPYGLDFGIPKEKNTPYSSKNGCYLSNSAPKQLFFREYCAELWAMHQQK